MNNENEILDEEFEDKEEKNVQKLNYTYNSIKYILLMCLIGSLLTNLLTHQNLKIWQLLIGASTYIFMGILLSSVVMLAKYVFSIIKKGYKVKIQNPLWYEILENGFYFWCVIVIITFVGNFLI